MFMLWICSNEIRPGKKVSVVGFQAERPRLQSQFSAGANSFDDRRGGTRVLANPQGDVHNGKAENPRFDPGLTVAVGSGHGARSS